MSETAQFSVLMSVYIKENAAYLRESLESLCRQTLPASQIVLVEDGPLTRELEEQIVFFASMLPLTRLKLANNQGLGKALNAGLQQCHFELVARLDTDDVALPDRFEKQVNFMSHNPDIAVCSGIIKEFDQSLSQCLHTRHLPKEHADILHFAKFRSPVSHPAVMYRKSEILAVGGYPDLFPEDYPLWCLLLHKGVKFANLSDVLVHMRTGSGFTQRRGLSFLKGELAVFNYMYTIGFINRMEWVKNCLSRLALRFSPPWVREWLYKVAR